MEFQIPSKLLFTHFMERSEHKMWRAYFALTILRKATPCYISWGYYNL
jgi:hypothetical protein